MTKGGDSSGVASQATSDADSLSPQLTIQESASTKEAVTRLRRWASAEFEHCVVTGPPGSGRTHFLEALAGILPKAQLVRCSFSDPDWQKVLDYMDSGEEYRVLIDNFDLFDGKFIAKFLEKVALKRHRVAASAKDFDGRISRQWSARLTPPHDIRLGSLGERGEDVVAFLPYWVTNTGRMPTVADGIGFSATGRLVTAMRLPRGFGDLTRLLDEVVALSIAPWDPPDAPAWIDAYTRIIQGPQTAQPAILVEGITDAIYLLWVCEMVTGSPPTDVEIEACQSASKIPERAFAYRNEGRRIVALFDYDGVGKKMHEQMKQFGLGSVLIPERFNPIAQVSIDHVLPVVEIEDLLPAAQIERFMAETGCRPELVIEAPRIFAKRIVVHAEDKLQLAKWVRSTLRAESAPYLIELYNLLREKLSLPALESR